MKTFKQKNGKIEKFLNKKSSVDVPYEVEKIPPDRVEITFTGWKKNVEKAVRLLNDERVNLQPVVCFYTLFFFSVNFRKF